MGLFKMSALILCYCFAALLLTSVDCQAKTDKIADCNKCGTGKKCKITVGSGAQECAQNTETTGATGTAIVFPEGIIIPKTYTTGDIIDQYPATATADVEKPFLCPGKILCFGRKCLVKPPDSSCPDGSDKKETGTMDEGKCVVVPDKQPKSIEDAFKTCSSDPGGEGQTTNKNQGKGSATVWYISKGVGILTILMNLFM